MTPEAIEDLSYSMALYIVALKRAPTRIEIKQFITNFIRGRKNGRLCL